MSICRCSHDESLHAFGRNRDRQRIRMGCTAQDDSFNFCKCQQFQEAKSQEEIVDMSKKKVRKPKGEGRKPVLAEFVKEGFNIFASYKGKEIDARVRADGVIVYKDKEYATPNAAGMAATGRDHGIDGYKFWRFKKNGEEVALDTLRGSKSPLKAAPEKPKRTVKAKSSKANGKPKASRKPRAKAPAAEPPTSAPERRAVAEADLGATL